MSSSLNKMPPGDGFRSRYNNKSQSGERYSSVSGPRTTNDYRIIKGRNEVARSSEGQAVGTFNISNLVVGGCSALILGLLAIVWGSLTGDVADLKKDQKETTKVISEAKLEIVKGIAAIEKQAAQTNQKLEDFIIEMRKRR